MYEGHNVKTNRLYRIWAGIKTRCYNKQDRSYKNYGARGITMCKEWSNSFDTFRIWALANGYSDNLTIDRIDVNGDYEPSNCRWASNKEQANNKTNNLTFTFNNETHTLTEWAEIYGIEVSSLHKRIRSYGFSFEEAITKPCEKRERLLTYKGETKSMSQWAKELNIPYSTLRSRLNNMHWTVDKALSTPYESFYWSREGK